MEQVGMHCSRVKNLLSAYCDRELGGDEMLAIRRHLGDCPECRLEHEGYQQVKLLFRGLEDVVPTRDFDASVLDVSRGSSRRPNAVQIWGDTVLGEAQECFRSLRRWSRRMFPTFHTESQLVALACVSVAVIAALAMQRPQPADAVRAHVPEILASDYSESFPSSNSRLVGYGAPGSGTRPIGVIAPDGRILLFRPASPDPALDLQSEPYWRSPDYGASLAVHRRESQQ